MKQGPYPTREACEGTLHLEQATLRKIYSVYSMSFMVRRY
jgi:hypothetical protein